MEDMRILIQNKPMQSRCKTNEQQKKNIEIQHRLGVHFFWASRQDQRQKTTAKEIQRRKMCHPMVNSVSVCFVSFKPIEASLN